MKRKFDFVKMHGLGNDFIIIDCINQRLENINPSDLALKLCDRYFGIGANGLILVLESSLSDIQMRIFNSDGSEAETCGNGIRCFSKYVYENQILDKEVISVETLGGIVVPALIIKDGHADAVEVDMGKPTLERGKIPMKGPASDIVLAETLNIAGTEYSVTCVSVGNPHAVVFVDELKDINIESIGPLFENHHLFPEKINTEFVQILNREKAAMLVWERGAGKTLACGSGACAATIAGILNNKLDRKVTIHLPGGKLQVEWQESDDHIILTGPADFVFKGEVTV